MKVFSKAAKAGMITKIITVTLLAVLLICMTACSKNGVPEHNSETEKPDEAAKEVALLSEYWTEGSAAAESINEYMSAVTDESSPDYIPPEDRIAVFDLDGTLMCETDPFCFEYMVFADYALNSGAESVTDEVKSVAQEINDAAGGEKPEGMSTRQASAAAIACQHRTRKSYTDEIYRRRDPACGHIQRQSP